MIEKIREWLLTCPYLDTMAQLLVEYLGNEPVQYDISEVPANPIIQTYLDGTTERQLLFNFSSREYYGREVAQNIQNSNFYKNFADWLELKSQNGELPEIDNNIKINKIEALSNGYLFQASDGLDNAKYNIQCRVLYTRSKLEESYSV